MIYLPKVIILDRDNTINFASHNTKSPLYYITIPDHIFIKPGVKEALQIIRVHGIPVILVTKQRCISKGLISREQVDRLHVHLQRELGFTFQDVLIEEVKENKEDLFKYVVDRMIDRNVPADEIWLFDDSKQERWIARTLGVRAFDGTDLLEAVCDAFCLN